MADSGSIVSDEEMLHAFLESTPDRIYFKDASGRYIRISRSKAAKHNLEDPSRAIGKTDFDFFAIEHATKAFEDEQRVIQTAEPMIGCEEKMTYDDGRVAWASTSKLPFRDRTGKIVGTVGTSHDITARKLAEEGLKESETRFRTIFEGSTDAILTLEPPTWRYVDANPAALAMFKVKSIAEFTSSVPPDLSPKNQHDGRSSSDAAQDKIQAAMRDGSASFEWTYRRLDGQEFPAAVLLTRIERGGRYLLQGSIRDLSKQRALEIDLAHARKLEAVGQLASGIAHEINTPAQYVGDGVHFLKEAFEGYRQLVSEYQRAVDVLDKAGGHEALVKAIRATEERIDLTYLEANAPGSFVSCQEGISRISSIVRAMKEFAHPGHKEKAPANLNQALQTTLAIARNEYKYVAEVTTEFGDLPPVLCHVGDLNQVFLNLIVNAAHAIADVVGRNGEKGTIAIGTWREGDLARIDISDTGAGIPAAIRPRIFEPFFTTKEVGKGTGQGLAIARSIVTTKHGGSLSFESEVGKGTTFTIRLPILSDGVDSERR